MTRISLISVEYCSLETPAMSAAPYAHQWHTKPNIFGLNLSPVVIRTHSQPGQAGKSLNNEYLWKSLRSALFSIVLKLKWTVFHQYSIFDIQFSITHA
jgi:hypothetical protein